MGGRKTRAPRSRRALGIALLATAILSCHGARGSGADASPITNDAGKDGASALAPADAGPPPDDMMPPPEAGDELTTRVRHLLEAIAKDDPQLATDIEFPRDGWLLTHDAADPGKDWEKHVARPFRAGVHGLSRRHKELDRAELVAIEVGHAVAQVAPKRHGWKKPLWSVRESRVTFVVDGRTRTLPIREMTSWRGAWYVTRLR